METETIDRIELMTRGFAVVLVALTGIETLCGNIEGQMGPFGTFAALASVGVSWHARLLRDCLGRHPKVFVVISATCLAAMTAAFLAAAPIHAQTLPMPLG